MDLPSLRCRSETFSRMSANTKTIMPPHTILTNAWAHWP
jgi:hypothetical protein